MDEHVRFTEEALRSQDGKKIPLKDQPGEDGRIIGEATLHYDEGTRSLKAELHVDDPKVAEMLKGSPPVIFRQEGER